MKKFLIALVMSAIVITSAVPYFFNPKPAQALFGVGDVDIVFDPTSLSQAIEAFKQFQGYIKQFENLTGISTDNLFANIEGVMGEYGLGDLSGRMSTLLDDLGLNEMLKGLGDKLGGGIGAGGILQGALGGVLTPGQTINMVMKQVGFKVPQFISDNFQKLGIYNTDDIVGMLAGDEAADKKCEVANPDEISRMTGVLRGFRAQVDPDLVKTLVGKCALNKDQTLALADPPTATLTEPLLYVWSPCNRRTNDSSCLRTPSSLAQGSNGSFDLPTDPAVFIQKFITIILGIAGGIALISIMLAGYKLLTSSGKPETVQQGREQMTAAIVGLIFIIFSFVIFQVIVIDVLKIPGICSDPNDPRCSQPNYAMPDKNGTPINKETMDYNNCVVACNQDNATRDSCIANILPSDCASADNDTAEKVRACREQQEKDLCKEKKNCEEICNPAYKTGGGF